MTSLVLSLLSVQVGRPTTYRDPSPVDGRAAAWTSAIAKQPVTAEVWLGHTGLDGDGQADLVNHGGPDRAVNVYSADHFPYWAATLGVPVVSGGAFGENFTVAGAIETGVCLGDVFRVGDATVQISQPRQPCWKLARRWDVPDLAARVEAAGHTGWYMRVLAEGIVRAGLQLVLSERPHPDWPMDRVYAVARARPFDPQLVLDLASCSALSEGWRTGLRRMATASAEDGPP
jgi:MOSC domain-containing protein YiiM